MNSQGINNQKINFRKLLDKSLRIFFSDAMRITLRNPSQAFFFFKTVRWQRKASRLRSKWNQQGIKVPPMMIFSITNRCNLNCTGCYHQALDRSSNPEMNSEKLRSVFSEASELGISFCIIAGGEPLVRKEFIDITNDFPRIIFLVFTNGLLLNEILLSKLKGQNNFVPVISMEGYEEGTDGRRGKGIYKQLLKNIRIIKKKNLFWSVSLTVTRSNFSGVTEAKFINTLVELGCKLFFFLEYTPIKEGTEHWVLTKEQRKELFVIRDSLRLRYKALFISVPGDEEEIGGCLAAGKGFIHISAEGNVEPCPFAPYSDANLNNVSLKEALQSNFLKAIRDNHEHLNEEEGGCALWIQREWVHSVHQQHHPEESEY